MKQRPVESAMQSGHGRSIWVGSDINILGSRSLSTYSFNLIPDPIQTVTIRSFESSILFLYNNENSFFRETTIGLFICSLIDRASIPT